METETTTIEVSIETWRWLNSQMRPREAFDGVLTRLREANDSYTTASTATNDENAIETLSADLDLPDSREVLEQRRAAIAQLYTHLQREGRATKADFLELVDSDDVGYASAESFWANCIKGRDSLAALPGVKSPGEGEHTWQYTNH